MQRCQNCLAKMYGNVPRKFCWHCAIYGGQRKLRAASGNAEG